MVVKRQGKVLGSNVAKAILWLTQKEWQQSLKISSILLFGFLILYNSSQRYKRLKAALKNGSSIVPLLLKSGLLYFLLWVRILLLHWTELRGSECYSLITLLATKGHLWASIVKAILWKIKEKRDPSGLSLIHPFSMPFFGVEIYIPSIDTI